MDNLSIRHLNEAIKDDSLIIFVGAGVSANSGLPNWSQLIEEFKSDLNMEEQESDYLKIAQYYFDIVGKQNYFQKIDTIFRPYMNAQPNKIHNHIYRIKPRHLITTNYDSILEDKMNSGVSKYEVIKEDNDIPYSKADRYLIKMHGDLLKKNIVLKEEDYLEYENKFYMISTLIKSLIMNNTILFIGYSLNDSTFNSIFRLVQKGFSGNARNAYFFTVNKPNDVVIEYYKNKGIRIISHEQLVDEKDIGECTANFLGLLETESISNPETAEQLWDNISFFDQLSFVSTQDVVNYSNLSHKVHLHPKYNLNWNPNYQERFIVSENEDIKKFITEKTWFKNFLDYNNSTVKRDFHQNFILLDGYKLYENNNYKEASQKFRELANDAFGRKDYWNYLVAEFNVKHIHDSYGEEIQIDDPISGSNDIDKMLELLISNGDEKTRRTCMYFRDEIYNFRFIYRVIFKLTELRDKLRNERKIYKQGGYSSNSNLWQANFEFKSLMIFISFNCITIFQYREFLSVINLYFECLLIAHDNSNYNTDENESLIFETSSIIDEISLDDVQLIIPFFNRKNLSSLMENYQLSKICVSQDVTDYLSELIINVSKKIQQSDFNVEYFREFTNYIYFLSVIQLKNANLLITVLEKFPIFIRNNKNLATILRCLINEFDLISDSSYKKIMGIINSQLGNILTNSLEDYSNCWHLYSTIIQKINDNSEQIYFIDDQTLYEKLLLIDVQDDKINEINKYQFLLINLYKYFSPSLNLVINSILSKYENLNDDRIDINFIEQMILYDVNDFETKKDNVLETEVDKINKSEDRIKYLPNLKNEAISNLFTFIQKGFYTLDEVNKHLSIKEIKGSFPEVDWVFFNDYSDEVIAKLVKNQTFPNARKHFGRTHEEKKRLDEWLIRQVTDEKIKIYDTK